MEVRPAAGESLDDDVVEVPLQVTKVMRHILLDHCQRALESGNDVSSVDVGPRVLDDDRNAEYLVSGNPGGCAAEKRAEKPFEHV